jgi:phage shock protein PspC (stress-responsive transcriptional regulator)
METTEVVREPKRLTRPKEGRWFGGVAAGLGNYFDLNPLIYRVAFVALSLAGGTGILLYAAAWLVIPEEGSEESIATDTLKKHRDQPALLVGFGLLAFAAILALSSAHWWPSPGNLWILAALAGAAIVWWATSGRERTTTSALPAPSDGTSNAAAPAVPVERRRGLGSIAAAAMLVGFGVIAIVDAATDASIDWRFVFAAAAVAAGGLVAAGLAAGHPVGSVIGLGFVILALLAVSVVIRVPLFAGVGDRTVHPANVEAVDDRYRLGVGDLEVNLSDVQFPAGETHVKATLGIGDLQIRVPEDATVRVDARASAGQVDLFGHSNDGTSVHEELVDVGTSPLRVLVVDARVGLGQVEVVRG